MSSQVDCKVTSLTEEVFKEFGKVNLQAEEGRQEFISKEDVKVFL